MNNLDLQKYILAQQGKSIPKPGEDIDQVDTAETIIIHAPALIKMLKHGRAGVPMEVMGLMLGEFVDEFTVRVVDVFAMPQTGTTVNVEAVDAVFQTKMLELQSRVTRPEMVVGWYHSHPGFGCWLSSVDENTQQAFERLHPRAVAVVVDPIRSVRGKVVIEAFRLIDQKFTVSGIEPRQVTSNIGHLNKPTVEQLIRNLNRNYYKMAIKFKMNRNEQKMLLNITQKMWSEGLQVKDFEKFEDNNLDTLKNLIKLCEEYEELIKKESKMSKKNLKLDQVGKINPKKSIKDDVEKLMSDNISQTLGTMLNNVIF